MPIFPVYALFFVEHGLSGAEISSLFVVWSVTTFVLEVPSGAWADVVPRRRLLVASALVSGLGYAVWMGVPSYAGFLAGFVLWGASAALASGTFEAFVYDELDAAGEPHRYAQVVGWATSTTLVAMMAATLAAAPLVRLGGIELTGWVSVGVCALQGLVAWSLPAVSRQVSTEPGRGYLTMLRSGLAEATGRLPVRRAVAVTAAMYGFLAFDEYFGLAFADLGAGTSTVALLLAVTAAAQAVGGLLAAPANRLSSPTLAVLTALAAVLIGAGAASSLLPATLGIALGYGVLQTVLLVSEARLQETIEGSARATVTSVAGFGSEVLATSAYVGFGIGSVWLGFPALVTAFAVAPLLLALVMPRWLPGPR